MSRTWYGSLDNRLEENRQFCETIEVGTGMTEYLYSDRHPYEVVEVKDQKHVSVRGLDHKKVGDIPMDNNWELISNENNPVYQLSKRGKYWYWTVTVTSDILEGLEEMGKLFPCGCARESSMDKGKAVFKCFAYEVGLADASAPVDGDELRLIRMKQSCQQLCFCNTSNHG